MSWTKLGNGTADEETLSAVLERAGQPVSPPAENWLLTNLVQTLDFVPKNKPFLIGEPSIPGEAQGYLDAYPAGSLTARWLLKAFYPCRDPRYPENSGITGGCYGCKTEEIVDFGHVYASKTSLEGLVEGIVSSLANWKLYANALRHFDWTPELLTSDPEARFFHALRPIERATAGTVVHTQYCCAHLLEFYQKLIEAKGSVAGAQYRRGVFRERVERGLVQLEQVLVETTPAGEELLVSLADWSRQLLEQNPV